MNKAELIDAVAKEAEVSKATAKAAVNATLEAIKGALQKKDRVQLVGFGTFLVSKRKARTVRNPKTGEKIQVPARNVVKFRVSAELAKKVK